MIRGTGTTLRGLSQPIEIRGSVATAPLSSETTAPAGDGPPPNKIVGVVCSGDLAVYRDQVKTTIERGKAQRPDAVWVCIEPKSDRLTHDVMLSLDIEPVVLPLNDAWRRKAEVPAEGTKPTVSGSADKGMGDLSYDLRRVWRDFELLLCDEVIVFHKRTGNSPWRERASSGLYAGRLFVVELGAAPKARARKTTRKPVGVA